MAAARLHIAEETWNLLSNENDLLLAKVEEMRVQLTHDEDKLRIQDEMITELEQSLQAKEVALEKVELENDKLSREKSILQSSLDKHGRVSSEVSSELVRKDRELQTCNTELNTLRTEMKRTAEVARDTQQELLITKDSIPMYVEENESMRKRLDTMVSLIGERESEAESLRALLESEKTTTESLRQEKRSLLEEMASMRQKSSVEAQTNAMSPLLGRIEELSTELQRVRSLSRVKDEQVAQLETAVDEKTKEFERVNNELIAQIDKLEQHCNDLSARKSDDAGQLENLMEIIRSKDGELQRLEEELASVRKLEPAIVAKEEEVSQMKAELAKAKEEVESTSQKLKSMATGRDLLLQAAGVTSDILEQSKPKSPATPGTIVTAQDESVDNVILTLTKGLETAEQSKKELEGVCEMIQGEMDELLERYDTDVSALQKQLEETDQRHGELESVNTSLQQQLDDSKRQCESMSVAVRELETSVANASQVPLPTPEPSRPKEEVPSDLVPALKNELQEAIRNIKDAHFSADTRVSRLEKEVRDKDNELQLMQGKIESYLRTIENLSSQLETLKNEKALADVEIGRLQEQRRREAATSSDAQYQDRTYWESQVALLLAEKKNLESTLVEQRKIVDRMHTLEGPSQPSSPLTSSNEVGSPSIEQRIHQEFWKQADADLNVKLPEDDDLEEQLNFVRLLVRETAWKTIEQLREIVLTLIRHVQACSFEAQKDMADVLSSSDEARQFLGGDLNSLYVSSVKKWEEYKKKDGGTGRTPQTQGPQGSEDDGGDPFLTSLLTTDAKIPQRAQVLEGELSRSLDAGSGPQSPIGTPRSASAKEAVSKVSSMLNRRLEGLQSENVSLTLKVMKQKTTIAALETLLKEAKQTDKIASAHTEHASEVTRLRSYIKCLEEDKDSLTKTCSRQRSEMASVVEEAEELRKELIVQKDLSRILQEHQQKQREESRSRSHSPTKIPSEPLRPFPPLPGQSSTMISNGTAAVNTTPPRDVASPLKWYAEIQQKEQKRLEYLNKLIEDLNNQIDK